LIVPQPVSVSLVMTLLTEFSVQASQQGHFVNKSEVNLLASPPQILAAPQDLQAGTAHLMKT
jgi:hypothetical protein